MPDGVVTNGNAGNGGKPTDTNAPNLDIDLSSVQKGAMTVQKDKPEVPPTPPKPKDDKVDDKQKQKPDVSEGDNKDNTSSPDDTSGKTGDNQNQSNPDDTGDGDQSGRKDSDVFINDAGDLVDTEGNVVREKGTFDYDEKTGEVSYNESVLEPIIKSYQDAGVTFADADNNPITFEDTVEGHQELTDFVARKLATDYLSEVYTQNPELEDFHLHLKSGKPALEYYKAKVSTPDYENTEFKVDSPVQHEKIMMDYLTLTKNFDEDEALEHIKYLKDSESLKEKAEATLPKLKQWQADTNDARIEANKAKIREANAKVEKFYESLSNTIEDGDLGLIQIPKKEKEAFNIHVTEYDEKGKTKADIAYNNLDAKQRLIIDYLIYKGFDLEGLIRAKAQTLNADRLGKKVTIVPKVGNHQQSTKSTNVNNGEFSLDSIV